MLRLGMGIGTVLRLGTGGLVDDKFRVTKAYVDSQLRSKGCPGASCLGVVDLIDEVARSGDCNRCGDVARTGEVERKPDVARMGIVTERTGEWPGPFSAAWARALSAEGPSAKGTDSELSGDCWRARGRRSWLGGGVRSRLKAFAAAATKLPAGPWS